MWLARLSPVIARWSLFRLIERCLTLPAPAARILLGRAVARPVSGDTGITNRLAAGRRVDGAAVRREDRIEHVTRPSDAGGIAASGQNRPEARLPGGRGDERDAPAVRRPGRRTMCADRLARRRQRAAVAAIAIGDPDHRRDVRAVRERETSVQGSDWKARCRPSGDHAGREPNSLIFRGAPPSAGTTQIPPSRRE